MANDTNVSDRLLETLGTFEVTFPNTDDNLKDTAKSAASVALSVEVWSENDAPGEIVLNRRKTQRSGRQVVRGFRLTAAEAIAVLEVLIQKRERLLELQVAQERIVEALAAAEKEATAAAKLVKDQEKAKRKADRAAKKAAEAAARVSQVNGMASPEAS